MDDNIRQLPFDQLRTLHREIGALIAERRTKELDDLRERAAILGFTADDLLPKKNGRSAGSVKYRDPDNPQNTYAGKGPKPQWLRDALEAGRQLDEFLVA